MAEIEKTVKGEVKKLGEQLQEMSVDMRIFSLTLRSLYVENSVGTYQEAAVKFRKLRDDTRNDAMVYLNGILPLSTKFVSSISEYFEYYIALEYDEWCGMISDILEEVAGYKQLCTTLLKMHEDILVPLKKRKDEATLLVSELKDLKEVYEGQKEKLEAAASHKRGWALSLCWIPGVNVIAIPLLEARANSDLAEAVAKGKQAQIQEVASIVVTEALIPALQSFINGIKKAAGFFSVMEQELKTLEGNAEKAKDNPKKLYYKVMSKEAKDMKSICQIFFAVLPDVRTDFLAIPTKGTDQNYVDRWLAKQKKTIQENCKVPTLVAKLLKAVSK
ncbi:uncharacterized protein [Montipora capricornis]|uniref:uncharacterized protein n=1 Tax=Montipora capricornis TaxID=246305 RepID=UPI0035F1B6A3